MKEKKGDVHSTEGVRWLFTYSYVVGLLQSCVLCIGHAPRMGPNQQQKKLYKYLGIFRQKFAVANGKKRNNNRMNERASERHIELGNKQEDRKKRASNRIG